uniref:protein MobC n=1 Tax=uncultured Bilophila sp. TaxID=529385 RepID=UPI0025D62A39|nr:protein MobC [uncultured Bilophila sp.]
MNITASQLKEIRQEFARLKPATVTLDGNRTITVKQAIFTLAPTLERMKKRGFDTQEIVEKLHEKGIEVKPQTLTKYLTEARRQREGQKARKRDTPPPASETRTTSFIVADTSDEEL